MTKQFEVLATEVAYQGFFRLEKYTLRHTLFEGGWSKPLTRELFRRANCVAVLLYDPVLDQVVIIEQFRVGAILQPERSWMLEIVAGAIEEGETAREVAFRESKEEAGCDISELIEISQFYTTPGGASERITLFCGRVDASQVGGVHGLREEDEDILVRAVSFDEVYQLFQRGEIESAIPIIAIQWLFIHRQQLKAGHWGSLQK